MEKLKVVVISNNIDDRLSVKNRLDCSDIAVAGYSSYDDTALLKVLGLYPDAVICIYDEASTSVFELSRSIYTSTQGCAVIMLSKDINLDILNSAMNCGIRQVLGMDVSENELQDSIRQQSALEKQKNLERRQSRPVKSKVISFFGGKGGVGKTTLAVNIAVSLSQMGKKVIIIDCDLQFGDVNLLLDLEPKDTILELVLDKSTLSADSVRSFTMLHSSGVGVLCAPKSPEYAEYVTGKHIESIISILRPYYEYIILDLSPSFNDTAIAAVENSDTIFLVSLLNISSLKSSKVCINVLDSLQLKEKVSVLINRVGESIIKARDFESVLNLKVTGSVLEDTKTATKCQNMGSPIVIAASRSQIAKDIKTIAEKIAK